MTNIAMNIHYNNDDMRAMITFECVCHKNVHMPITEDELEFYCPHCDRLFRINSISSVKLMEFSHPKLKLTLPWDDIESGAQNQIKDALKLDCVKKLAIMPDVHKGYDLPIGSVALLDDHVWPGGVGYDIGCGMSHINTHLSYHQLFGEISREEILSRMMRMIPVGTNRLINPRKYDRFRTASKYACLTEAVNNVMGYQLGTLGGGNHFIEIGVNSLDEVGITIHSGSRRAGWLIADFYMRQTGGPIHISESMGSAYIKDMKWASKYALFNRQEMMASTLNALGFGSNLDYYTFTNEHHNDIEFVDDGIIHRKGATPAYLNQTGIIPGNMCDGVYITKGLGNKEYMFSASHGAGRIKSRTQAKKDITQEMVVDNMKDIMYPFNLDLRDESREAYKSIHDVVAMQDGELITVMDHFKPSIVLKG